MKLCHIQSGVKCRIKFDLTMFQAFYCLSRRRWVREGEIKITAHWELEDWITSGRKWLDVTLLCMRFQTSSPCESLQRCVPVNTAYRLKFHTTGSQSSPDIVPGWMHNICADLIRKSQLATATKKRKGKGKTVERKKKPYSVSKMRLAKRKRCRDTMYSEWMRESALGIKYRVRLKGFGRIYDPDVDQ